MSVRKECQLFEHDLKVHVRKGARETQEVQGGEDSEQRSPALNESFPDNVG